jgi:amphi-Trp domain-containing protein
MKRKNSSSTAPNPSFNLDAASTDNFLLHSLGFLVSSQRAAVGTAGYLHTLGRTTHGEPMSKNSERDIEKIYSASDFVAKLRRLADSIESGQAFEIQVAGERLYIPADATFNIEHERSGNENELEFQLRW